MLFSSIDIGTNTVLLLIAEVSPDGTIVPLVYEQRVPRLGKGVDASRRLEPEAMHRVINVLKEYSSLMAGYPLDGLVVAATSAVRDAANREEFARMVREETGFSLVILSGEEEAAWTYRGGISGVPGVGRAAVIDIGGGSTEITLGDAGAVRKKISLDIGSVRLTERFFKHDPPLPIEIENAIEAVEDQIARASGFDLGGATCIAVAGTATALAILAQGLKEFRREAVSGYILPRETVERLFQTLTVLPSAAIGMLSNVMEGRADIMTAGALILRELTHHFHIGEIVVSERGLRYGLIDTLREEKK